MVLIGANETGIRWLFKKSYAWTKPGAALSSCIFLRYPGLIVSLTIEREHKMAVIFPLSYAIIPDAIGSWNSEKTEGFLMNRLCGLIAWIKRCYLDLTPG